MAMSKLLKDRRLILVIALAVAIAAIAAWAWLGGGGGGGGGGNGGSGGGGGNGGGGGGGGGDGNGGNQTTTTPRNGGGGGGGNQTYTPPPGSTLYPDSDLVKGFNVIFIEDHVEEAGGGAFRITVRLGSSFTSLVAYGGSSVTGNITYGTAYIITNHYKIPILGFASTNATVRQDFPGMKVRLTADGGHVVYPTVSMAIYYRRHVFNISNTVVYVWVPAKSLPSTLATEVTQHVTVDPETGFYYVNGAPYRLTIDAPPTRLRKGVLRSWVLHANRYGVYVFQINP